MSFKTFEYTGLSKLRIYNLPIFVFDSYKDWLIAFNKSLKAEKFSKLLLLPMLAPTITFFVSSFLIQRKPKKSEIDKGYFASFEDVQDLNIFGTAPMVLGRLNNFLLRPKKPSSSLVWFSEGLGKTASIAIPSILESDDANVVAVDCSGTLSRFTSGYRSIISHIYNFSWDKVDDYEKGEFYPRWNPLSSGNMPRKLKAREAYIKSISQYLIVKDANNYWERLASSTLEAIIHYFVSKVEQASANDYFLSRLFEGEKLIADDKELLREYYLYMPEEINAEALKNLKNDTLNVDNYLPVGSWYNIPDLWQGKEVCFAMIVDTLIYIYCDADMENEEVAVWKEMLLDFVKEGQLFGYHQKYLSVFDNLIHLTIRQRRVIFGIILEALASFRKISIRERTSLSDFNLSHIRGVVNEETGEMEPVTVYSSVLTKHSGFMTVMLVDMLLGANLNLKPSFKENSLFFLFDDFEILPRFKLLNEAMGHVSENNMSFMILTRDLEKVSQIYDKETLEEILIKTEYKLFSDENNSGLSDKLKAVGGYVSQSVATEGNSNVFSRPHLRGELYNNVSKDFLSPKVEALTKGQYILFADVFYGRPIKVGSIFFAKNQVLRNKASLEEISTVEDALLERRNLQDVEVPEIVDVIRKSGVDIQSEKDIQNYIIKQKDIDSKNIAKIKHHSENTQTEAIDFEHEEKEKLKNKNIKVMEKEDNWWLNESAFSVSGNKLNNPFGN